MGVCCSRDCYSRILRCRAHHKPTWSDVIPTIHSPFQNPFSTGSKAPGGGRAAVVPRPPSGFLSLSFAFVSPSRQRPRPGQRYVFSSSLLFALYLSPVSWCGEVVAAFAIGWIDQGPRLAG